MKKSVRFLALIISVLLLFSTITGCSGSQKDDGKTGIKTEKSASNSAESGNGGVEPLTMPITKEKLDLTFFIALDAKVGATMKTFNEIAAFKEMEKISGIHIVFQHPPIGQEQEQFNLMLASQNLPDIIYTTWLNVPGGPAKAIEDNSILKLNDAVNKYAPNFKKDLDGSGESRKQFILDDGSIFMFPMMWLDPLVRVTQGLNIRKDWLDKLGLNMPATIDDWYTVLKAFKEKDPNGNGSADEIPFATTKVSDFKQLSGAWGIDAYDGFYQDKGKIKYSVLEPKYKDYLATMAKWYKEGLIDPEYMSVDSKNFDAKITGNKVGAFVGSVSGNMGRYMNLMAPKDPKFQLAGVPWPSGDAGKPYVAYAGNIKATPGHGAALGAKNKHVKESVKWLDYFHTDEGHNLFTYGIQGESYVMKDGKPTFTDKVLKSPEGLSIDQAVSKYCLPHAPIPIVRDPEAFKQIQLALPVQKEAVTAWGKADTSLLIPTLTPTRDESSRIAAIMNEVTTYENEFTTKIIMGAEPMSNFEKHVNNIKGMGIDEAVKIMQAAYDRFNARK